MVPVTVGYTIYIYDVGVAMVVVPAAVMLSLNHNDDEMGGYMKLVCPYQESRGLVSTGNEAERNTHKSTRRCCRSFQQIQMTPTRSHFDVYTTSLIFSASLPYCFPLNLPHDLCFLITTQNCGQSSQDPYQFLPCSLSPFLSAVQTQTNEAINPSFQTCFVISIPQKCSPMINGSLILAVKPVSWRKSLYTLYWAC